MPRRRGQKGGRQAATSKKDQAATTASTTSSSSGTATPSAAAATSQQRQQPPVSPYSSSSAAFPSVYSTPVQGATTQITAPAPSSVYNTSLTPPPQQQQQQQPLMAISPFGTATGEGFYASQSPATGQYQQPLPTSTMPHQQPAQQQQQQQLPPLVSFVPSTQVAASPGNSWQFTAPPTSFPAYPGQDVPAQPPMHPQPQALVPSQQLLPEHQYQQPYYQQAYHHQHPYQQPYQHQQQPMMDSNAFAPVAFQAQAPGTGMGPSSSRPPRHHRRSSSDSSSSDSSSSSSDSEADGDSRGSKRRRRRRKHKRTKKKRHKTPAQYQAAGGRASAYTSFADAPHKSVPEGAAPEGAMPAAIAPTPSAMPATYQQEPPAPYVNPMGQSNGAYSSFHTANPVNTSASVAAAWGAPTQNQVPMPSQDVYGRATTGPAPASSHANDRQVSAPVDPHTQQQHQQRQQPRAGAAASVPTSVARTAGADGGGDAPVASARQVHAGQAGRRGAVFHSRIVEHNNDGPAFDDDDDDDDDGDDGDDDDDDDGNDVGSGDTRAAAEATTGQPGARVQPREAAGNRERTRTRAQQGFRHHHQSLPAPPRFAPARRRPPPPSKRRGKIEIKYIEEAPRRHVCFTKRKSGLMKKAHELSVLTGTEVLLVIASPAGSIFTFSTPRLRPLISKPSNRDRLQRYLSREFDAEGNPLPMSDDSEEPQGEPQEE